MGMRDDSFLHRTHPVAVTNAMIAAAEDIFNGDPASDVISMKDATNAVFIITTLANAGGNAAITVLACDDTTPSNTAAIPFSYRLCTAPDTLGAITRATVTGFTTSTSANITYTIEVDEADLNASGYSYVQLKCTEDTNAAVDGSICGFLTGLTFNTKGGMLTQVT